MRSYMSFTVSAFPIFGRLRPTLLAMSLVGTLGFSACSAEGPTTINISDVTGTRPMRTANNKSVPTTFTDAAGKKLTIESGSLKITSDGKYALAYVGHLGTLDF